MFVIKDSLVLSYMYATHSRLTCLFCLSSLDRRFSWRQSPKVRIHFQKSFQKFSKEIQQFPNSSKVHRNSHGFSKPSTSRNFQLEASKKRLKASKCFKILLKRIPIKFQKLSRKCPKSSKKNSKNFQNEKKNAKSSRNTRNVQKCPNFPADGQFA